MTAVSYICGLMVCGLTSWRGCAGLTEELNGVGWIEWVVDPLAASRRAFRGWIASDRIEKLAVIPGPLTYSGGAALREGAGGRWSRKAFTQTRLARR